MNFIDKIRFQLYKTYDGESYHDVANNWSKVTEELMQREDFGKPLGEDNQWLDKVLAKVVEDNDRPLQAAKKIYYYLQNDYTCTNRYDKYIKTSLIMYIMDKTIPDYVLIIKSKLYYQFIS